MKCIFCGRTISNKKSMERGMGPSCAKKHVGVLITKVDDFFNDSNDKEKNNK